MADRSEKMKIGRVSSKVQHAAMAPDRWLMTGGPTRQAHLILAHGAGAGMESPFLTRMADLLDGGGITVHRFEFSYMATRSKSGLRRPAPRAETLLEEYQTAVAECRARIGADKRLFIGGKSMGGRIACLAARSLAREITGVAVLGFPLIPPAKPEASRANVLEGLTSPTLVVQGTRDAFGGPDAFANVKLPACVGIHWVRDGDHDLKPRKASGWSHDDALRDAARALCQFFAA